MLFSFFIRALYCIYCLLYSLNLLKSLELSAFKLINLGARIILLEGSNVRIGKYYYIEEGSKKGRKISRLPRLYGKRLVFLNSKLLYNPSNWLYTTL